MYVVRFLSYTFVCSCFTPLGYSCPAGFFFDLNYCNWQGVDIQLQRVDDDDADRFHNIGLGLPSLTKLKGLD